MRNYDAMINECPMKNNWKASKQSYLRPTSPYFQILTFAP